MTAALIGADLGLCALIAASWIGLAVATIIRPVRGRRDVGLLAGLLGVAVLVTVARVVVVGVLAGSGWWFVQEKLLLALPLVVLPAAVAAPLLARFLLRPGVTGRPSAGIRTALLATAYGAAAGIVVALVVVYPATALSIAVLYVTVAALAAATWVALTGRGSRAAVTVLAAVAVVALLTPVVLAAVGGGGTHDHSGTVSVANLRETDTSGPVHHFDLTARQQDITLASGTVVHAWTFGSVPGPTLTVTQGELVEVVLHNTDIAEGVTVHWHGYDVPNGDDGVAGVTQDAVAPGHSFTYRFRANQVGTYWYHSHQDPQREIERGLYGALVVLPRGTSSTVDLTVPVHTIEGEVLVGTTDRLWNQPVFPNSLVRLRLINADPTPHRIWIDADFRVVAVDGYDLNGPTVLSGVVLRIPAGGRYDVEFTMPGHVVPVAVEGAPKTGLLLAPPMSPAVASVEFRDAPDLDLFHYGTPSSPPPAAGRDETMVLDRAFRLLGSTPTYAYTINGDVFPDVAPLRVHDNELVRVTVVNRGTVTHPMHPHGHHVLVLSRNGETPTGSPLWLDTFDVRPGEVWQVLLRADNPGIWLFHCHNLPHATQGMVMHLAYDGVFTPYELGGPAGNKPE